MSLILKSPNIDVRGRLKNPVLVVLIIPFIPLWLCNESFSSHHIITCEHLVWKSCSISNSNSEWMMRVPCDVCLCKHKRRSVWMEERASEQIGSSPINGPSHLQPLLSTVGDTERGHIQLQVVVSQERLNSRQRMLVSISCWSQAWPNIEGYKAKVDSFLAYWNIWLTVESPPLLHKVALLFTVLTWCFLPCLFILHRLTSLCLHMHSVLANIL